MGPEHLALMIPITALSIPIVAILTGHFRKMAEIKARMTGGLSEEVRAELSEIKSQLTNLRDTTTKFDMAFDAALSRLEERMDRVEQRQSVASNETTSVTVGRGGA